MKKFLSIILATLIFFSSSVSSFCVSEDEQTQIVSENLQKEEKGEFKVTLPRILWSGVIVLVFVSSQIIIKKKTKDD